MKLLFFKIDFFYSYNFVTAMSVQIPTQFPQHLRRKQQCCTFQSSSNLQNLSCSNLLSIPILKTTYYSIDLISRFISFCVFENISFFSLEDRLEILSFKLFKSSSDFFKMSV